MEFPIYAGIFKFRNARFLLYQKQSEPSSLPTRERGLKDLIYYYIRQCNKSLPTRERGLKDTKAGAKMSEVVSLPTRERGLKE